MEQIVIDMGEQLDGYTFRLDPLTRQWLYQKYPETQSVSSVFISFDRRKQMKDLNKVMWPQIITLLTGLSEFQVNTLKGFRVMDPRTSTELYNSTHNVQ